MVLILTLILITSTRSRKNLDRKWKICSKKSSRYFYFLIFEKFDFHHYLQFKETCFAVLEVVAKLDTKTWKKFQIKFSKIKKKFCQLCTIKNQTCCLFFCCDWPQLQQFQPIILYSYKCYSITHKTSMDCKVSSFLFYFGCCKRWLMHCLYHFFV